ASSRSVVLTAIVALLAERSSWILMVDAAVTVVVHSAVRIPPRLTAPLHTWRDTSPRTWSLLNSLMSAKSSSHTPSAWLSLLRCTSIARAPRKWTKTSSPKSSERSSSSRHTASWSNSSFVPQSTDLLRVTDTSAALQRSKTDFSSSVGKRRTKLLSSSPHSNDHSLVYGIARRGKNNARPGSPRFRQTTPPNHS